MKQINTIAITLLICLSAVAQPVQRKNFDPSYVQQFRNIFFGRSLTSNATNHNNARTTSGDSSRVIALVDWMYSPTQGYYLVDSLVFFNSGTECQGGTYQNYDNPNDQSNSNSWNYVINHPDSTYDYTYDTTLHLYTLSYKEYKNVNPTAHTASFVQHQLSGSGWTYFWQVMLTYDTSGNDIKRVFQYWDEYSSSWNNFYNSKDSFSFMPGTNYINYEFKWTGYDTISNIWKNPSKMFTTYDAANKWEHQVYYRWDTSSLSWKNFSIDTFAYNASGKVIEEFMAFWNDTSSIWNVSPFKINFFYDGSGNLVKEIGYSYDTAWENYNLDTFINDGSGNILKHISYNWGTGSWDNYAIDSNNYNTYNQLVYWFNEKDADSSGWNSYYDYVTKYYYELYVTSVQNVSATNGDASLYPVPTSTQLNVAITWQQAQSATLQITDLAGRKVYEKAMPERREFIEVIPVAAFSKGNYILTIAGEKGNIVKKFTVN